MRKQFDRIHLLEAYIFIFINDISWCTFLSFSYVNHTWKPPINIFIARQGFSSVVRADRIVISTSATFRLSSCSHNAKLVVIPPNTRWCHGHHRGNARSAVSTIHTRDRASFAYIAFFCTSTLVS